MAYSYLKALHIIFVVTWFAGLFYIVRLFIYHTEAHAKSDPERSILTGQYKLMSRRLWYGITWPSAILTLIFGSALLHYYIPAIPGWLWVKIGFVAALLAYHLVCHRIFRQLQKNVVKYSGQQLRVWNEVATLFLVTIVFLVVLKNTISILWGIIGLVLFAGLLMFAINLYRKYRKE